MIRTATFFGALGLAATLAFPAAAQQKDKEFKDWSVYTTTLQGKKTCYAASFPTKKSGNYNKRDEPYFIVTRIRGDAYEVSTYSGYPYKAGSDVALNVQGNAFAMFTKGERAWAQSEKIDGDIVAAMKKGSSMSVKGTSIRETYSTDNYSLMGFSNAVKRMDDLCR
ncbi:MAG: invasion associated locus B family protein [Rickettsiales bacterium]